MGQTTGTETVADIAAAVDVEQEHKRLTGTFTFNTKKNTRRREKNIFRCNRLVINFFFNIFVGVIINSIVL